MSAELELPGAWLEHVPARHPSHVALMTRGYSVDYRNLYARLGSLSFRFAAEGLIPGEPTVVLTRHRARTAWAAFLSFYDGLPLLPLDVNAADIAGLLDECAVTQAIADESLAENLTAGIRVLPAEWLDDVPATACRPPLPSDPDAAQLLVATSGTTATPRIVMLTGANLAAAARASRACIGLEPGDVWLDCLPLTHIGGFAILTRCLQAGATVLLHESFDPERVWRDLLAARVTHLSVVPAMLWSLLEHACGRRPPQQLRRVLVGGGAASRDLAERASEQDWPWFSTYGMSETASHVTVLRGDTHDWQPGIAGSPIPGAHVEIVDERDQPAHGTGRVHISGPMVMAGYANARGLTGIGLTRGGFTSNDVGMLDERGRLWVLGRDDEVLVSGGRNVHPHGIEARLAKCPGLDEVAVTSRRDPAWGDCLVALVVGSVSEENLEQWCRANMPDELRPREFVKIERLPRTSLGKLERHALRDLVPVSI